MKVKTKNKKLYTVCKHNIKITDDIKSQKGGVGTLVGYR